MRATQRERRAATIDISAARSSGRCFHANDVADLEMTRLHSEIVGVGRLAANGLAVKPAIFA